MASSPSGGGAPSIFERVKAIILHPGQTWPDIERETRPSGELFTRYAVPLAAIGPVCQFLHGQIFGYGAFGFSFRPSLIPSLLNAIVSYVLALVMLFVVSFIVDKLAPKFGGAGSSRNAFKLVVYAMTASWVASVFLLIPMLGILAILGLYSVYLFYTGVAPLMKVPAEKALTFTIVTAICVISLTFLAGAITGGMAWMTGMGSHRPVASSGIEGGKLTIPGVGTLDTGSIDKATKDLQGVANGDAPKTIAPTTLQALLPASIGAYQRTSVESSAMGAAGSRAEGTYEANGKDIQLSVTDMSALGAISGIAAAMGVENHKQDADSYEHTATVNGNLVSEKWNKSSKEGSYTTTIDKRFMIEAEGTVDSIDQLKAAAASIDTSRLAALAAQ